MIIPDCSKLHSLRTSAGLTQHQAAEMVHLPTGRIGWSKIERGLQQLDAARWELFRIKCGEHELYKPVKGVPVPKAGDMARAAPIRSVEAAVKAVTSVPKRDAGSGRPGPKNR